MSAAVERKFNQKLEEVLLEIENPKHRAVFQLITQGHTQPQVADILGYASEKIVGRVYRSKRYAHIRRALVNLRHDAMIAESDGNFLAAARKWRNEKAIPLLNRVTEEGEPRDAIQALRMVGKWTGLEDTVVEVRGTVDHRHVLQSPEMRRIRQMLDSGQAVIVGDAPPAFELPEPDEIEAEVVEEAGGG